MWYKDYSLRGSFFSPYENTGNDTLLFKDAVGSIEEFKNTSTALETIASMTVYGGDDNKSLSSDVWVPYVYRILLRHFRNWQIAFDNVDDFLDMLWERIEAHVPNFFERKYQYLRFLGMSDEQLLDAGEEITNYIEHNDDKVNDVYNKLKNLTNQTQNKNWKGIANELRAQVRNANMDLIKDFCKKFNGLFLLINTRSDYMG